MTLFGTTRSRSAVDHALICPDSFVPAMAPGWEGAKLVTLITPRPGGPRFVQALALMDAGGSAAPAAPGIERALYVLEGELTISGPHAPAEPLRAGGFAFLPADGGHSLRANTATRVNLFEKRYLRQPGYRTPSARFGQEQDVTGEPFLGDPDAVLKTLLPTDLDFDLAMNVFTFRPGAALPLVEVHVMEHGLLMLAGQGVYRLSDAWYPVQAGDVIWMASYCPQWFVAMGKEPARYLYYKDVNRDPWTA